MNKIIMVLLAFFSINAYAQMGTEVIPYTSTCYVGQACQVGAQHSIRINNDTRVVQTYTWVFSLVAENGDVVKKEGTVTLQPGEEYKVDRYKLIGYMKFNMRGRKTVNCATQAHGWEHSIASRETWVDVI